MSVRKPLPQPTSSTRAAAGSCCSTNCVSSSRWLTSAMLTARASFSASARSFQCRSVVLLVMGLVSQKVGDGALHERVDRLGVFAVAFGAEVQHVGLGQ